MLTLRLVVALAEDATLLEEVALAEEATLLEEVADAVVAERLVPAFDVATLRLDTPDDAPVETLREDDLGAALRLVRLRSQPPAAERTGENARVLESVSLTVDTPP